MKKTKKLLLVILTILTTCVCVLMVACGKEKEHEKSATSSGIAFKTLSVQGTTVTAVVPNAQTQFDFMQEITVGEGEQYVVSLDEYGMQTIITKIVPLSAGNNTFYVIYSANEDVTVYTVQIRRRPMYSVTFNTSGGDLVAAQSVEEGCLATTPEENPTRTGFSFVAWDYDFSQAVTGDITINATWSAFSYMLTYRLNGGIMQAGVNPDGYDGDNLVTFVSPTRENYRFVGWYTQADEKIENTQGKFENLELTAKWETIFTYTGNTITGLTPYGKENCLQTLTVPSSIDGTAMTGIGKSAFENVTRITGVKISSSIKKIDTYAFEGCTNLQTVVLPDALTSVGSSIFLGCDALQYTVENNVAYVGSESNPYFLAVGVATQTATSVTVSDKCKFVAPYAFAYNKTIKSATVYAQELGEKAFFCCSALETVTCEKSTDWWDETVNHYSSTTIGESAFGICQKLVSATLADSVKYLGDSAFSDCTKLTTVHIGDGVEYIGDEAFSGCNKLTTVSIGNGIEYIGEKAFEECDILTYNVDSVTYVKYLGNSSNPYIVAMKLDFAMIENLTFANTCRIIYHEAFVAEYSSQDEMVSLIIPDSVVQIGNEAFYARNHLTQLTIGANVKYIGDYAFAVCNSLKSVDIPASVQYVGMEAFDGCYLEGDIFDSVTYSGTLYVESERLVEKWNENWYNYDEAIIIYRQAVEESDFSYQVESDGTVTIVSYTGTATDIKIPSTLGGKTVTAIGANAFSGNTALTAVVMPNEITKIGEKAFYGCSNLTEIYLSEALTVIENSAFQGGQPVRIYYMGDIEGWCGITFQNEYSNPVNTWSECYINNELMTEIMIPQHIACIGAYTFRCFTSLTSVIIPDGVTSIGSEAFAYCYDLVTAIMPDSVTSLGHSIFYGCSSLQEMALSKNITEIPDGMFRYCSRLNIAIPEGVTTIGRGAFGCAVENITIPKSVTRIYEGAFGAPMDYSNIYHRTVYYQGSLEDWAAINFFGEYASPFCYHGGGELYVNGVLLQGKIIIRGNIRAYAFNGCGDLITKLTISDEVTSIGNYAFSGCDGLTSVTIGDSVANIGDGAFWDCNNIMSITVSENNMTYKSVDGNLYTKDGTTLLQYAVGKMENSFTIPEGVTNIGEHAFSGCSSLTSVVIPDGVISIKSHIFRRCTKLTSVTIPNSVKYIWNEVFTACENLTAITFNGTKAQWNEIEKSEDYWYVGSSITKVVCTDGEIAL